MKRKNVKIPKGKDPASLTLEECLKLADETPDKKTGKGRFAGKAKETPAAKTKKIITKPKKTTTRKVKASDRPSIKKKNV